MITAAVSFVAGVVALLAFGVYLSKKDKKKDKKKVEDVLDKLLKQVDNFSNEERTFNEKVRPRLEKATQISMTQADLIAQTQAPSKNALHSKYKNGIVGEIKALEEEKCAVLKSILDDGFNPEVTATLDGGERKIMPLKDYMELLGIPTGSSKEELRAKRKAKFTVIQGGKSETTN